MPCWFMKLQLIITLILLKGILKYRAETIEDSLLLVHVIFCHGEKTADPYPFCPNDPYVNETSHPLHTETQLTMVGKQKVYRLGKTLRKKYGGFLGEIHEPSDLLDAQSSDASIAKTSMELVLAGLFPPSEENKIDSNLNWQPITYKSSPSQQDTLFFGSLCSNYEKYLKMYTKSRRMQTQYSNHQQIFDDLKEKSGRNVTDFSDALQLYECLETKEEMGIVLPQWTKEVYPETIRGLAIKSYQTETGTVNLRRLAAGYLLEKIVEDTKSKLYDTSPRQANRKMHLYSGHRFNIAHLLIILGIFDQKIPPLGSYISLEVHRINGVDGIKIFYEKNDEGPYQVKLPSCPEFCPFETFLMIAEEYRPPEDLCRSQKLC